MLLRTYLLIDEQNSHIAKFYKKFMEIGPRHCYPQFNDMAYSGSGLKEGGLTMPAHPH